MKGSAVTLITGWRCSMCMNKYLILVFAVVQSRGNLCLSPEWSECAGP